MEDFLTQWSNYVLIWIGFGTLVGLLAKAILPGVDPGGAFATVFIGIFGTVIGAASIYFFTETKITPISLLGFAAAIVGTTLLLVTYRILNGRVFPNGFPKFKWNKTTRRRTVTIKD